MCNHSRSSPFVRISHCASVLATGLYSACTGLHLVDDARPDYCSAHRTPPHRPTHALLPEDEQHPPDVAPLTTEEDLRGATRALETLSAAEADDDDDFSDTSTIKPKKQHAASSDATEEPPGVEPFPPYEEPPAAAPLVSTDALPVAATAHPASPSHNPPAVPGTPTAAHSLHATTVRWQQENADRRAREEEEARKPWVVRKVRRGVEKARERRRTWVRGVRERRRRLWWDWQVWLVG